MKVVALGVAIALALTAPAFAAKKKIKRVAKPVDTMTDAQRTNDASYRLVRDSLPIWLPAWSLPLYMQMKANQEQPAPAKPKRARRHAAR